MADDEQDTPRELTREQLEQIRADLAQLRKDLTEDLHLAMELGTKLTDLVIQLIRAMR